MRKIIAMIFVFPFVALAILAMLPLIYIREIMKLYEKVFR